MKECVRILKHELAAEPQELTASLYDRIRENKLPVPAVKHQADEPDMQGQGAVSPSYQLNRIVTVLFIGTAALVHANEDTASLFLRLTGEVVGKYGGRIDRFYGATVLAVFGKTQIHESDPELAIRAVIELRREANKINLPVKAGVHTGSVHVEQYGQEVRL